MVHNYSDVSLGEFPGEISLILYSGSCVCKCPWCFNPDLLKLKPLSFKQMKDAVDAHEDFITAVVFSGGEPLLNPYLIKIIKYVKEKGLKVKLNTCGLVDTRNRKNIFVPFLDYINVSLKGTPQMMSNVLKLSDLQPIFLKPNGKVLEYSFVYSKTLYPKPILESFHDFLKDKISYDGWITCCNQKWTRPDILTVSQIQTGNCADPSYNDCNIPTEQECMDVGMLFKDIPAKKIVIETQEFGRKTININNKNIEKYE